MSRKSRPPKTKGKGRKGKKGTVTTETSTVVEEAYGPPFGIVVLVAIVLSIPTLLQFVDGTMAFDSTVIRFLAALAVSWILIHLVYTVASSFSKETTTTKTTTMEQPGYLNDPNAQYRLSTPPEDGTR